MVEMIEKWCRLLVDSIDYIHTTSITTKKEEIKNPRRHFAKIVGILQVKRHEHNQCNTNELVQCYH
jgi:hypothetical protein